jgi:hypothetical protein
VIVRWSQRAATQLFEAGDYLDHERPGTSEKLYAAAQEISILVGHQPRAFRRAHEIADGEVREALVERYGHWMVFEIFEARGECLVLAFWPTRRRPYGWRR